jgi:hypothetical protein
MPRSLQMGLEEDSQRHLVRTSGEKDEDEKTQNSQEIILINCNYFD